MTVEELIAELQKHPPSMAVRISVDASPAPGREQRITGVFIATLTGVELHDHGDPHVYLVSTEPKAAPFAATAEPL